MDQSGVQGTFLEMWEGLRAFGAEFVPRLVGGFVVLVVGWLLAKIIRRVLTGALRKLRFDDLTERIGVQSALAGMGIRGSLSEGIAGSIYYLILVLFLQAAARTVGMHAVSDAITALFAYLPNVIAAVLTLVLGNVVAGFARKAVEESGRETGIDYAPALGRAVGAATIFIVAIMAITQLGIDTELIHTVVLVGLAGGALGMALSFGLGSRDATRNVVAGFYARKVLVVGEEVEVDGVKGVLTAVTPTCLLIESEDGTVSVANRRIHETSVRQRS